MASDASTQARRQVTVTTPHGETNKLECHELWLDDGNIVLAVQGKGFRVHRTILSSYSETFKDLFAIPHSDDVSEDGCPVVHLQDTVQDIHLTLKALYDRSFFFFYSTPIPTSVLEAFLRMGKKYAIKQLFEEAERRLSFDFPPWLVHASKLSATEDISLFPRISGNDRYNFTVMNIANEVGLTSVVAMAILYCCIACPPDAIAFGYDFEGKRYTLSAASQQYCLLGQRYLADVERQIIQSLAYLPPTCTQVERGRYYHSSVSQQCAARVLSALRSFQDRGCPFSVWVPAWDEGLCAACRGELRKRHEEARTRMWKKFPEALGLDSLEALVKDTEVA